MAWDTDGTRSRLRAAATAEFAERGPHATTMAGIADRAGINKERLYKYFGDKQTLFDALVAEQMETFAGLMMRPDLAIEDPGEFAGRVFDELDSRPHLARLLLWHGLADPAPATMHSAAAPLFRLKVEGYRSAQRDGYLGTDIAPDHLVYLILGLVMWWGAAPVLAGIVADPDESTPDERSRQRAAVVAAADRLSAPELAGRHRAR